MLDLIRGLSPVPCAFTCTPGGKLLKLTGAVKSGDMSHGVIGEVISLDDGITVACSDGAVTVTGVIPEGKGRMSAADYIRGRKLSVGDILGSN